MPWNLLARILLLSIGHFFGALEQNFWVWAGTLRAFLILELGRALSHRALGYLVQVAGQMMIPT